MTTYQFQLYLTDLDDSAIKHPVVVDSYKGYLIGDTKDPQSQPAQFILTVQNGKASLTADGSNVMMDESYVLKAGSGDALPVAGWSASPDYVDFEFSDSSAGGLFSCTVDQFALVCISGGGLSYPFVYQGDPLPNSWGTGGS